MTTLLQTAHQKFIHRAQRDGYSIRQVVATGIDPSPPMFESFKGGAVTLTRLWAVTKPSPNPSTGHNEFGIQRRHFKELIGFSNEFFERNVTQFSVHDTKLIFYIAHVDEFMKISLKKAEEVCRVFDRDTIHPGGTIFIPVGHCVALGMTEHGTVQKSLETTP